MRLQNILTKYIGFPRLVAVNEFVPTNLVGKPAKDDIAANNYRAKIVKLLKFHNLPEIFHPKMLMNLDRVNYANVNSALEIMAIRSFKFSPLKFSQKKPLMVVGLPGIGKTSAISKMAAEAMAYNKKVHIITTDTKRAGGVEHIANFADVLGTTFEIARTPAELKAALKKHKDSINLIDSAGANPYDVRDLVVLRDFINVADIEPIYVMQAGGDVEEAIDLANLLSDLHIERMIVTKTDSARRLGSVLATALHNNYTLANFSSSSNVGRGLDAYSPKTLAIQLLKSYVVEDRSKNQY